MLNVRPNPRATFDQATTLLDQAIAHVLPHGYSDQSLRNMATSLGTSHRMLIYYFGDVDGFWEAVVEHLQTQHGLSKAQALTCGDFRSATSHRSSPHRLTQPLATMRAIRPGANRIIKGSQRAMPG